MFWIDDSEQIAARAGGGGYGDFTDGEERSIRQILAVYPDEVPVGARGLFDPVSAILSNDSARLASA